MLEKPAVPDEMILAALAREYDVEAVELTFLPIGYDQNTAIYRAGAADGALYFLKLRKGPFAEITVSLPAFLQAQGNPAIIAPLAACSGRLWGEMGAYRTILYPFVEGRNGYEARLSAEQWVTFGAALKRIHTAGLPPGLRQAIPAEDFSPAWRRRVREFQAVVKRESFREPVAAKLAAFMQTKQDVITHLVDRAEALAGALQRRPLEPVLCHSDLHPGNLHLTPNGKLSIVDWDNPVLAAKERDLMHIGGSPVWNDAQEKEWFFEGYGETEINRDALAYYRCERIIQDIAEFCRALLLTEEGGADREQSYGYFVGQFLPGHEIDLAMAG